MSDENIERQVEFLLEQQAQSAARIRQIEEIILSLAQGTRDRFHATDKRLDDGFEATDKRLDDVDVKIAALVDSQIRTEESVKETAQALRNLIAVVDRYFESRNGGSGAPTNPQQ